MSKPIYYIHIGGAVPPMIASICKFLESRFISKIFKDIAASAMSPTEVDKETVVILSSDDDKVASPSRALPQPRAPPHTPM